jgi:hypothetical protein
MEAHHRQCMTATGRAKKTFKVFEDAVKAAHKMNDNPKTIWKQRAYKCRICLRFHVGRDPHNIQLNHKINIYGNG